MNASVFIYLHIFYKFLYQCFIEAPVRKILLQVADAMKGIGGMLKQDDVLDLITWIFNQRKITMIGTNIDRPITMKLL